MGRVQLHEHNVTSGGQVNVATARFHCSRNGENYRTLPTRHLRVPFTVVAMYLYMYL